MIVGPAGIQLMPDGHTLLLDTGAGGSNLTTGKLYRLPILPGGRAGSLQQVWESQPTEAPDGLAIARSGNVYVALVGPSGNAVDEVSPQGQLLARVSAPAQSSSGSIPFDAPGSVTFLGDSLLVANSAAIDNNSSNWAILQIKVGEPGLPPSLPPLRAKVRYRLGVHPARVRAGRRVRVSFRCWQLVGGRARPLAGATIAFDRRRLRCGRRGRVTVSVLLRRRHHSFGAYLLLHRRRVARVVVRTR